MRRGKSEMLESNIRKLYAIKAIRSFMLTIPVIVLFFKQNGLSMSQVFLLQALFSVAVLFLEVPTGYFADRFGRKLSIGIGGIFASLGFIVYSLSHGFWGFLMAETILGFGLSFVSGADSALLYDTLLERKGGMTQYQRFEGRSSGISLLSESVASILGGLLATVSLRFPLYWDAVIAFSAVPIAMTLVELKRHTTVSHESSIKSMVRIIRHSLCDHIELKWLIVYSSFASASTLTMVWFIQIYLTHANVAIGFFGIIWATFMLVAAIFSWNAYKVEKILGKKVLLITIMLLPVFGYFLLSSFWSTWLWIFISLFYVSRGLNNPIIADYVNKLVSSDVRATTLSVKNMMGRVIFSVIGTFAGWVYDAYSLQIALQVCGSIFLFLGVISIFFMHKHKLL